MVDVSLAVQMKMAFDLTYRPFIGHFKASKPLLRKVYCFYLGQRQVKGRVQIVVLPADSLGTHVRLEGGILFGVEDLKERRLRFKHELSMKWLEKPRLWVKHRVLRGLVHLSAS